MGTRLGPYEILAPLMINGENDFISPFEISQEPLFRLIGTADDEKRHALLQGGHLPPDRLAIIEEVLTWLDRYLGPVVEKR